MGRTMHHIRTGESSVAFVSLEMTSAETQARVEAACAVPETNTKKKGRDMTPTQIKAIRNQSRLSQSVFASRLGLSVRTVQEWEQGRRKPNGPAQALLRILSNHPEVIADLATE